MSNRVSFHEEYQRVQSALRKRLFALKKVDFAGSAEQLLELGAALRREGNAPYAALCSMAVAHCCRAMRGTLKEAHYETEAGGLLWGAERDDWEALEDLVPEATACYLAASDAYARLGKRVLAGTVQAELAGHLAAVHRREDAAIFYQRASEMCEGESPQVAGACLRHAVEHRVACGDYAGALECAEPAALLLERELCAGTWRAAPARTARARSEAARMLLTQGLLHALLGDCGAARRSLDALSQHGGEHGGAGGGGGGEEAVVPLVRAWVDAVECGDRAAAVELAEEAAGSVVPLHRELLARGTPPL